VTPPLRIGILGAARIAAAFVAGARLSSHASVVAVASREAAKAATFARTHGVASTMSYEQLLAARDIDAVYIPLPNSLHAEWSIRAARAGKHVLCEKPLAISEAEALEMFAAADAAGVVLLEAFPYLFQPQMLQIEQLVASGAIGELRSVFAAFGFSLSNPEDFRLVAKLGGGALLDAGCYAVSFIRQIVGCRPSRVTAAARWQGEVDQTLAATLEFESGVIGQVSCGFASGLHRSALVAGSAGVIETEYQNHTIRSDAPSFRLRRGGDWRTPVETIAVPRADGFHLEIDAFADLIRRGDTAALAKHRAASIDNAWTLAAILAAAQRATPSSASGT
jgi:D-xylose 1-dehydrogenase (NADP+, D-xylono-1,5-lactone-forming)